MLQDEYEYQDEGEGFGSLSEGPVYRSLTLAPEPEPPLQTVRKPKYLQTGCLSDDFTALSFIPPPTMCRASQSSANSGSTTIWHKAETSSAATPNNKCTAFLRPMPIYVEKYTSFLSSSEPQTLYEALLAYAAKVDEVEFEANPDYNIILCFESASGRMLHVSITLFQSSDGQRVVEVQRRRGCCLGFGAFFRDLVDSMSKLGHVQSPFLKNTSSATSTVAPQKEQCLLAKETPKSPLSDLPGLESSFEMSFGDTLSSPLPLGPLVDMATKSPFIDEKREALETLASLTRTTSVASALTSKFLSEVKEIAQKMFSDGDEQSFRCSAKLLFNLSWSKEDSLKEILEIVSTKLSLGAPPCSSLLLRSGHRQLLAAFRNLQSVC